MRNRIPFSSGEELEVLRKSMSRRQLIRGSVALTGLVAGGSLITACNGDDDDDIPGVDPEPDEDEDDDEETPAVDDDDDEDEDEEPVAPADPGGHLVIAFNADPEVLDPHITTALLASRTLALLHDSLIDRDYDGSFVDALADDWDVSDDGLEYTFHLKDGVTFHSGKEFTSEDVRYTFERWLATEGSPTAYNIEPVDEVETPDPQTVRFILSEPYNIFLDQLSGGWAVIINEEAVEEAGDDYGVTTVDGTGPFVFESWTRNQSVQMVRNDNYTWGSSMYQNQGPAHVDSLEIRIVPEDSTAIAEFLAGNIHLLASVPAADVERLQNEPDVDVVEYEQLQTTYLGMNTSRAPVDDVNVRYAINYALNREDIVEGANFGLGLPAYTMLHPDTPYYWEGSAEVQPQFDPDRARELLEDAGWEEGPDGIRQQNGERLVLPLWIINDSTTILQSQIIEEQLAQVGIEVATEQYEQSAWFAAARSGEQVAFIIGVFYANADILYFYFHTDQLPAPNRFEYSHAEIDELLEETRANPDEDAVAEAYEQIQQRLLEDAPTAPMIHTLGTLGVGGDVEGVNVHSSRWLMRMLDISLDA
jgi:peptide/nickel transport system substrate-binding protein